MQVWLRKKTTGTGHLTWCWLQVICSPEESGKSKMMLGVTENDCRPGVANCYIRVKEGYRREGLVLRDRLIQAVSHKVLSYYFGDDSRLRRGLDHDMWGFLDEYVVVEHYFYQSQNDGGRKWQLSCDYQRGLGQGAPFVQ